jgi:hypothetical protein
MKLHALLGYPVSENFVSWCQTLKNSPPSLIMKKMMKERNNNVCVAVKREVRVR